MKIPETHKTTYNSEVAYFSSTSLKHIIEKIKEISTNANRTLKGRVSQLATNPLKGNIAP